MQKYTETVLDSSGEPLASASVTIQVNPLGAVATIYSDNGVTLATNPLTTNASGVFQFYAADGRYDATITKVGFVTAQILDILLDDPVIVGSTYINLLTNTQWKIRTAIGTITKFGVEGGGTLPTLSVTGFTVSSNTPTFSTSNTSQLKVGDVVKISGGGTNVDLTGIEVTTVTANVSFVGALALGLLSGASAACTAQLITRGDISASTGAGPDPWNKTTALNLWVDDNAANSKSGSKYQVGIQLTAVSAQSFFYPISGSDVNQYIGRTLVFGCWVYYKIRSGSGTYRPYVTTNLGTTYGPVTSATVYTWVEVSATIGAGATFINAGVEFIGAVNDAAYFSQPMLAFGTALGTGNYFPETRGALFTPVVKFSPAHWINATLNFPAGLVDGVYPWTFYLKAETLEAVANEIVAAHMELEGVNAGTIGRALALQSTTVAPQLGGPIIYSQTTTVKTTSLGFWWFKAGTGRVYAINASDTWSNVSIDFSGYILQ